MKTSKYVVLIPNESKSILYNCRTDEVVQAENRLIELFNEHKQQAELIKEKAKDFYDYLCKKGFIVNDDVDETQLIIDGWKQEDEKGRNLLVIINPTMNCNLNCWYCYEKHHTGSHMGPEVLKAVSEYFRRQISSGRFDEIHLSFFGGEPLLYFKRTVVPILEDIRRQLTDNADKIKFSLHFTTNATLLSEKIIEYLKPWKPSFQITIDGDEFIHNLVKVIGNGTRSAYRITLRHIQTLLENKLKVEIRFNYTAKTLERFVDVLPDLEHLSKEEKVLCSISFHRIWQDKINTDTELSNLLSYQEQTFRNAHFFVESQTTCSISRCYGDLENSIVINFDGLIYKCTARDFNKENSEGYLQTNGTPVWNERHEHRIKVRYYNETCRKCILFALCHGICSQHTLEEKDFSTCIKKFSEIDKIKYICQHIKDRYAETVERKEE